MSQTDMIDLYEWLDLQQMSIYFSHFFSLDVVVEGLGVSWGDKTIWLNFASSSDMVQIVLVQLD